jgi:hypothetical protein
MSALSRRVRRLEALEKSKMGGEPIVLCMPDGRSQMLRGGPLELFSRARDGDRSPEVELIAQSISSTEPDGGHMIDLARALLNSPYTDDATQDARA